MIDYQDVKPDQLVKAVREVVEENPDFTYTRQTGKPCSYRPDPLNPQGCGIGAAYTRLGSTLPRAAGIFHVLEPNLIPVEMHSVYADEIKWLMAFQAYQDKGETWKKAMKAADDATGNKVCKN